MTALNNAAKKLKVFNAVKQYNTGRAEGKIQ
jgi:hypothetical protein